MCVQTALFARTFIGAYVNKAVHMYDSCARGGRLLQEMLFQIFALAVKQKVCLLNQTDRDLGDDLSGAGFRELAEGLKDDFGLSVGTSIMTIFHRSYKSL